MAKECARNSARINVKAAAQSYTKPNPTFLMA